MHITLVTGSDHKLAEWQRLLPADYELERVAVDLDEIQSLDSAEIIKHKLHQAYDQVQKPVLVEDVSAGIDKLNGLPGPFVKFFEQRLGKGALHILGGDNAAVTITCNIGYYDGQHELFVQAEIKGHVVAPVGDAGFGFDFSVVPAGQTRTFAQMTRAEKDAISHRRQAIDLLVKELRELSNGQE